MFHIHFQLLILIFDLNFDFNFITSILHMGVTQAHPTFFEFTAKHGPPLHLVDRMGVLRSCDPLGLHFPLSVQLSLEEAQYGICKIVKAPGGLSATATP